MVTIKEAIYKTMKDLDSPCSDKEDLVGLSTGFKSLDKILLGLKPGQLIEIVGRSGMGKTSLALNWALAAAKTSKPVAIFSYELLYGEVSMRLLSSEARVDFRKLKTKKFEDKELVAIAGAVKTLANLPVYIEDNGLTNLDNICETCRKLKLELGLAMIVIDYIQLMPSHAEKKSRKEEYEWLSKGLKELSIELETPVVVLSQISPSNSINRPQLSDLGVTVPLADEADVVCFIHREDYYDPNTPQKGIAEILVAKNREGELGMAELKWIASQGRFEEL